MIAKLKEIAAPFKEHPLIAIIWAVVTYAVFSVFLFLPFIAGGLYIDTTGDKSLLEPLAYLSLIWFSAGAIISILYALYTFHVRLLLFGGAGGLILLFLNLFYLSIKLWYATVIGYICLIAKGTSFIFTHTIPALKYQ